MRWKVFRPEEEVLRAEGHSHVLNSTVVKSLGLVLRYTYTGQAKRLARQSTWKAAVAGSIYKEKEEIYISTSGADRFGAGVIRGHRGAGLHHRYTARYCYHTENFRSDSQMLRDLANYSHTRFHIQIPGC